MKNKEILIKILLMLRSNGINNQEILFSVEKLPPHYYGDLLGVYYNFEQNYFDELIRLLKILQYAITHKKKINNVLISGFKLGWFLTISSLIAKRIYSICSDKKKINDLEKIHKFLKITNIYIKKGSDFFDWKKVAPFDLVVLFKSYKTIPNNCINLLDRDGLLFFTKENKNKVSLIKCNKSKSLEKLNINDFLLEENKIL